MTAYLGFDVLDQVIPNRRERLEDHLARKTAVLSPGTGFVSTDVLASAPNPVRPFIWPCFSRADVSALRAFLDARRGRVVPVWVPTWQRDLSLALDAVSGSVSLTFDWSGYARHLFPLGLSRRHLALWSPGQPMLLRKVTSATDPGDQLTESAGLDSPLTRDCVAAQTLVMFLRLCRLEDDLSRIVWQSAAVAEADLQFRELPMEVPA